MADDDPQDARRTPAKIGAVRAPTGGQSIVTERGGRAGSEGHDARRRTPGGGIVADFAAEEVTGNYVGLELEDKRGGRHPTERMSRLEKKADKFESKIDDFDKKLDKQDERLGKVEVSVAGMAGEFKVIPRLVDAMEKATTALHQQQHMTFTAKVEVDKAKQTAEVEVDKVKQTAEVEVHKAEKLDVLDAKKDRRKLLLTIAGAATGGGVVFKLLHHWGVL